MTRGADPGKSYPESIPIAVLIFPAMTKQSATRRADIPTAVIDVGSNSGRIVVCRMGRNGVIEIVGDSRASLRLTRDIDRRGNLGPKTIDRILRVMHDFRAVASGSGCEQPLAVATAAVREAVNGRDLCRRIQVETGIPVRILSGEQEARCGFLGAVHGLPVRDGIVLDVGGGSLQLVRFRDRRRVASWSLRLGALRMSERFLTSNQSMRRCITKLWMHVLEEIETAGLPRLENDAVLVGTGGTIRNLAKIDSRRRVYPIDRLHGYELPLAHIEEIGAVLTSHRLSVRTSIPGLNADRADSIIGGCFVVEAIMDHLGATRMIVSGQGLREGILLSAEGIHPPSVRAVRNASIAGITSRFRSWDETRADRRAALVGALHRKLDPDAPEELEELLRHAAVLLDIGRSIDYYHRQEHTAAIIRSTNLMGFSHREIAMLSAIIEFADGEESGLKRYRPILRETDHASLSRAAIVLGLADEIEHRIPLGVPARVTTILHEDVAILRSPHLAAWQPRELAVRFARAFGRTLITDGKERAS
jgi:exopolyphosphatase / guanosine-5'-triphosphate,3'-diphosphate pyrophosphatase